MLALTAKEINMDKKVWLITGASKGFGLAFTKAALADGNLVVAAARHTEPLEALKGEYPEKYGRIDVLVSNAGHLHKSVFEDTTEEEMRREFEVNYFGSVNVIQAALPHMRKQGGGRLIQTTSVAGLISFGFGSTYHASKFALEGMLDNLSRELRGTGISVTAFEPGSFRTDLMNVSTLGENVSDDYKAAFEKFVAGGIANDAAGEDPEAAAEVLMKVVKADKPPRHILIGKGLIPMMEKEYGRKIDEWKAWDWEKQKSGYSSINCRTVRKVASVRATVSSQPHIQFMSMWACPVRKSL